MEGSRSVKSPSDIFYVDTRWVKMLFGLGQEVKLHH